MGVMEIQMRAMKRYSIVLWIIVVFSVFVLFSCTDARNPRDAIIGKWFMWFPEAVKVAEFGQLEFLKDGTVIVDRSNVGDYKFIDYNRLRLDFKIQVIVLDVHIDKEGRLILKFQDGYSQIYFTEKAIIAIKEATRKEKAKIQQRIDQRIEQKFILSDFTVLDKQTKLMWTRDANIAGKQMAWDDAFKTVENLNGQKYAGHNDWRLPTKEELSTLIDFAKANEVKKEFHVILSRVFKNVQLDYWSATTYTVYTGNAWVVFTDDGLMGYRFKSHNHHVWLVRLEQ